jgi:phosphoglycolate phosphatase
MSTLFFDLDGTLIDSAVGITRCVAYALQRLDVPVPPHDELRRWIGPALRVSFAPLLRDAAQVEQAVELYRERFESDGWREHEVYPGIGECIEHLHAAGHRLAVVTAKNEPHARKIVSHLPFGHRFEQIIGASADGRLSHKPELIGEAMARLDIKPAEITHHDITHRDIWMIGDRHMDIDGARHHGLPSVGVLWGFGSKAELREAGATRLALSPTQLPQCLRA